MDRGLRKYCAFYFCYYAALGAYTPYIGRWVDSMGYSGYVVGTMLGLWYGSRIVAPLLWTALLQRSRQPGLWLVAGSVATMACFAAFIQARTLAGLLTVMAVFGLFYNALMPQFETMTLAALGERSADYGRIRVWGSIGFLAVAASYGSLLDRLGDRAFPWLVLPLFLALSLASWPHRHARPKPAAPPGSDAGHLLKRPGVRRFLLVALLMQMGFGAFYVFYTLHLQANGVSGTVIGLLWGTGVVIEIMMFWQAPRLIERVGAAPLMTFCIAVTVVRWTVTAMFAANLPLMFAAQCLHAFSFAVFHACCMRQIVGYFPGRRAAAGQSLLYGFSSGVGGVLGAALSALLWERWGGQAAFLGGAAVTALALVIYLSRSALTAAATGPIAD